MNRIKNFISEYKKSLESEEVLVENERRANIVLATAMLNGFIAQIIICVLSSIDVLDIDKNLAIIFLIIGVILLLIPSIACLVLRGKKKWLKIVLISSFTLVVAVLNSIFTYTLVLSLVFPVLFAARYYSKKFTIFVATLTSIIFAGSVYLGTHIGFTDLNYIDVPKGTTITIKSTLEDAVDNLELDQSRKSLNIMEQSFLPNLILYLAVIAFGCNQISKSGERIVKKQKELSEDKAKRESELSIASQIQKNILPSTFPAFPEHTEFDIYASMTPAKEVGGDFYDMFLIDENNLAILIADVSGKGVPASLIMMTAKSLIKNTALSGNSAENVFNIVNRFLCDGNTSNHFITAWFGILDLKTGVIEYVNAGHNPPVIYSKKEDKYSYLKSNANLILAIMDDTEYEKNEIALDIGDKILLYTDGVTEATSDKDELYGENRLLEFLNNHKEDSVTGTIKGIKQDIDKFIGSAEQFDDITMLEVLLNEIKED